MCRVKILGAGSVGNHFAYSCRLKSWDVVLTDINPDAIKRAKEELYPSRYGHWDQNITTGHPQDFEKEKFDMVIIGTPPSSHTEIAIRILQSEHPPKILLIEKPVSFTGDLKINDLKAMVPEVSTKVFVGYNHHLSPAIKLFRDKIVQGEIGKIQSIETEFREDSQFILNAHFWMKGMHESYLGCQKQGGGASFEHSHGIALWLYLAEASQINYSKLFASQRLVENKAGSTFDEYFSIQLEDENGYCGRITQDFMTRPPIKQAKAFGSDGVITWRIPYGSNNEELVMQRDAAELVYRYPKQRSTDFSRELDYLAAQMNGEKDQLKPLSWERGYKVFDLLLKSQESINTNQKVEIMNG